MNPNFDLIPWTDWLVGAGISFAIVVSLLAILGMIIGYLTLVIQYGFGEANDRFIFFLGTVGRDVVSFSPMRTFAIARLTTIESWRRWYLFLSLGLFFVFLLLGAWYLDADSEAPGKIYLTTVVPLSTGLILVFALVFSSIGLWTEFRTKTSLPLITKPVRGGEIVLGRILGVVGICTILVVVMGVVSYIFVVRGVSHEHTVDSATLALINPDDTGPNRTYRAETTFNRDAYHGHELTVNASGRGETEWRKGHWHYVAPEFDPRGLWEITLDGGSAEPRYLVFSGDRIAPTVSVSATRPDYQRGQTPGGLTAAGTASVVDEALTVTLSPEATGVLAFGGSGGPTQIEGSLELPLPGAPGLLLRGTVGSGTGDSAQQTPFLARQVTPDADRPWRLVVDPNHRGMLEARVPIYAPVQWGRGEAAAGFTDDPATVNQRKLGFYFTDREGIPKEKGINVGNEWDYRGFIEGDTGASAIWTFEGLREDMFPNGLPIEMDIRVFRSRKGDIERTIQGSLQLQAIDDNGRILERSFERGFESQEYKIQRITFPLRFESADGTRELSLFGDLVQRGRLQIVLKCEERGQYFGAARKDLYIRAADNPFWWNFTKAYFSLWLQMIVMVCLGTLFSTRLHFIIAMMASAFVLIIGWGEYFIAGVYKGILINMSRDYPWLNDVIERLRLRNTVLADVEAAERQWGGGMIESGIRVVRQTSLETPLELPLWVMTLIHWIDFIVMTLTYLMTWLIPDFEVLQMGDLLAQGRDINANVLGRQFGITLGYLLVLPIFGYFMLRTREVAS